jgi:dTMP kinase
LEKVIVLICVEGIDGSGKGTVTKLLREHFEKAGATTKLFSFPAYGHNAWSDIIGRYLNGEFGVFPIEVQASLFAMERFGFKPDLKQALEENDIVFCDRYVPSNLAYAAAAVEREREEGIIELICNLEYGQMGLPKPDCIVFLHMPVDLAIVNIAKKAERQYTKKTLDLLESKRELLHNASRIYSEMKRLHPAAGFIRVDCTDNATEDGLKSFSDIVSEIVSFNCFKTWS